MKTFRFVLIIAVMFISINKLDGQALHFSQIFYSPLNLNPALTGVIDADWRLTSNFRTQGKYFSEPLNTISLSFDKYFENQNSKIGLGILYNHDSSFGITIPSDQLYISGSGIARISENSYASVGIQLGFVWRRITYVGLTFPEQYDRDIGDFNPQFPTYEDFDKKSSLYPDINIGGLWWMKKNKMAIQSGISLFHVNNPTDHFLVKTNNVGIRTNVHTSIEYQLNSILHIKPQVYYSRQHKTSMFLIGSSLGLKISNSKIENVRGINLGIYIKNSFNSSLQSAIAVIGTDYKNWSAYLSTDIDISGLKNQPIFNSAIELSLIYHRPFALLNKFTLPCIRY